MRSVVVVFPASMCAMMPKLRTLLRSVSTSFCATEVFPLFRLLGCCSSAGLGGHAAAGGLSPAVVREGSVRFGHLVGVFASLDRSAQAIAGIEELVGQALDHRLLAALPREAHQPAQGQRGGTVSAHLDGNLVGRATHAAATDLQRGLDVVESALEGDDRIGAGLLTSLFERTIYNALGQGFLPFQQNF